jgi:hypothetical protein
MPDLQAAFDGFSSILAIRMKSLTGQRVVCCGRSCDSVCSGPRQRLYRRAARKTCTPSGVPLAWLFELCAHSVGNCTFVT